MTDRPPTILGPHGEGYCRYCRFVVGLGADGLMDYHERGQNFPEACKGGGKAPAKITPYASSKNQFHSKPIKAVCTDCGQQMLVAFDGRFVRHDRGSLDFSLCHGSFKSYSPPQR